MLSASRLEFVTWIPPSERAAGAPISNRQLKIFNCLQRHFQPTLSAKRPSTARLPPHRPRPEPQPRNTTPGRVGFAWGRRRHEAHGGRELPVVASGLEPTPSSGFRCFSVSDSRICFFLEILGARLAFLGIYWAKLGLLWKNLDFLGWKIVVFKHLSGNRGGNGLSAAVARSAAGRT